MFNGPDQNGSLNKKMFLNVKK